MALEKLVSPRPYFLYDYGEEKGNLLYIPSGETMNVDFFLTDYDQLSVGKYRIIFGLAHSNDFFYFPFDIVDS